VRSRVWQERTTPGWATVGSFRWMMMMTMISSFSFSVFLGSAHLTQPTKTSGGIFAHFFGFIVYKNVV